MDRITYCQYQKIIRKGAWGKFSEKHGIWDIIISLAAAVFVGFIWWAIFKRGIESMLISLAILGVFFLIYSVVYLRYYSREHFAVYNKNMERLGELVNADKITFEEVNEECWAYIKVYNGEDRTFKGRLDLTRFNREPVDTVFGLGMFINDARTPNLEWPPMSPLKIDFANIDKPSKNANIICADHRLFKQIESGQYEVETQLSGMLGEHEIKAKRAKWLLMIDRENLKIELKRDEKQSKIPS